MSKPKSNIQRTAINVRLPTDLVARMTIRLSDARGRTRHGAVQRLFEALLREYLYDCECRDQRKGTGTPPNTDPNTPTLVSR